MQEMSRHLLEIRSSMGLSQKEFADRIGVSWAAYKNYESGRRAMPSDILKNTAIVCGVSMDYIAGLTDIPYAPDCTVDNFYSHFNKLSPGRRMFVEEVTEDQYARQLKELQKQE